MDVNVQNTVDFLHQHCKENGIDFFCYLGETGKNKGLMVVTTKSKNRLINGMVKVANKDVGLIGFMKKIYLRLKQPYLWN
jgi:hypothetical protein